VPETAYLYDAVHLYERSLLRALDENRDPRNGREMVSALHGVHYRSAMGYVDMGKQIEEDRNSRGEHQPVISPTLEISSRGSPRIITIRIAVIIVAPGSASRSKQNHYAPPRSLREEREKKFSR